MIGLDRYQYSVSVLGRYHWYDTPPIPDGHYCFVMKADIVGATVLHLSVYTEAARWSRPTTTALPLSLTWTVQLPMYGKVYWRDRKQWRWHDTVNRRPQCSVAVCGHYNRKPLWPLIAAWGIRVSAAGLVWTRTIGHLWMWQLYGQH